MKLQSNKWAFLGNSFLLWCFLRKFWLIYKQANPPQDELLSAHPTAHPPDWLHGFLVALELALLLNSWTAFLLLSVY